jgi:hypothetical protein
MVIDYGKASVESWNVVTEDAAEVPDPVEEA